MTQPRIVEFNTTGFSVTSSWGSGQAITGISNANPAVVTRTGHGFVDGEVVKHAGIVGMTELNGRPCVVNAIDANTYSLYDVDSTNYAAYVSGGTVSKAVMSPSCQVTNYQGDTGTTPSSKISTNCGDVVVYGNPDFGAAVIQYAEASEAFITAMKAARKSKEKVVLKRVLPLAAGTTYDIGTVTAVSDNGGVNGNYNGGATIQRDFERIDL